MIVLSDTVETRARAATLIAEGKVVAFLTDTFYGLGVDPFNPRAIGRLKAVKGREDNKPILVIVSDLSVAERLVAEKTEAFKSLVAAHWPGPLTLVARARAEVPPDLTAQTGTIGVRLPADEAVREFLRACGGALTATSANPAGLDPARTASEVSSYFSEGLALIVDGGATRAAQPSTVVDVCGEAARLIREGELSWEELRITLREN
ncbi:MAG: L-threonylcarbamoyladenylate synthase [Pyrinomonadaceae bacterium]